MAKSTKSVKTALALLLCALLCFCDCATLFAAPEQSGDPNDMLTDPTFDLTTVDEDVMNEWLKQRVNVPDANFYEALKNAAGVADVDGLTRNDVINLSGTLDLTKKGITNLTGAEYLINVDTLILTNNNISSLEPIKNLYRIRMLDVSYNKLTSLDGYILEIESLEEFYAEDNKIAEVTAPGTLSNIKTLSLKNNALTQLPAMDKFSALSSLDISGNKLTSLQLSDNLASTLVNLDASKNAITSTSSFASYTSLQTVNLASNQLSAFPKGITAVISLQELQLQNNFIEKIPSGITAMSNLQLLQLENNALTQLPETLTELKKLESLLVKLNFLDPQEALAIKNSMSSISNFTYQLQKPAPDLTLTEAQSPQTYTITWNAFTPVSNTTEGTLSLKGIQIDRREYAKGATDEEIQGIAFSPLITLKADATTYTDANVEQAKDYEYKVTYTYTYTYNKLETEITSKGFVLYTNASKNNNEVGSGTSKLVRRLILLGILVVLMGIMGVIFFIGLKNGRRSRWHKE